MGEAKRRKKLDPTFGEKWRVTGVPASDKITPRLKGLMKDHTWVGLLLYSDLTLIPTKECLVICAQIKPEDPGSMVIAAVSWNEAIMDKSFIPIFESDGLTPENAKNTLHEWCFGFAKVIDGVININEAADNIHELLCCEIAPYRIATISQLATAVLVADDAIDKPNPAPLGSP